MPDFVPGLRLSERFYHEAVRPIVESGAPGALHAAALVGPGSEVLGFDTAMSSDHDWGPRLALFLAEGDLAHAGPRIDAALREGLPHEFMGYPTSFTPPNDEGAVLLAPSASGPVNHRVEITTVGRLLAQRLGVDRWDDLDAVDWLLFPEQALLEVTAGAVFHDGLGDLRAARAALAYHPHDVWLYRLAAQWDRVSQLEAFVGRCGDAGDELGSALVAASLVREVMRLCFLMERAYAPYAKWFGTAFMRLRCGARLRPALDDVLAAADWRGREERLAGVYVELVHMHNALEITAPFAPEIQRFHDRPFLVINADRLAHAIAARITDTQLWQLPVGVGAVDQAIDSTPVLSDVALRGRLHAALTRSSPRPAAPGCG